MKYLRLFFLIPCVLASLAASSQVGQLDLDFSEDGFIITNICNSEGRGECAVLQPDGKILFGGACFSTGTNDFGFGRLLPNGNYDPTFSQDGQVRFDLGNSPDLLVKLAVLSSGKIIAAGRSILPGLSTNRIALAKFNSEGQVDSTFGTNGIVRNHITYKDEPTDMEIQADGKILVCGYTWGGEFNDIIIARFLENGQFDTTFNSTGVLIDTVQDLNVRPHGIEIQADGKIVVAGYSNTLGNAYDYFLRRYNPNGELDTTFGVDGLVKGDFSTQAYSQISELLILPDGKLLVAGQISQPNLSVLAKFNEDGSWDSSFGEEGVCILSVANLHTTVNSIAVQNDGKILMAGGASVGNAAGSELFVARLLEYGILDQSFGDEGIQINSFLSNFPTITIETANVVLAQPDGKIILVGTAGNQTVVTRHLTELHVGMLDFTAEAVAPLIYPNPIVETATLQYELSEVTTINVELYDLQGKQMLTLLPETEQAEGKHELPVVLPSHLASGAYVLSVSNGKGRVAVQVMKQ